MSCKTFVLDLPDAVLPLDGNEYLIIDDGVKTEKLLINNLPGVSSAVGSITSSDGSITVSSPTGAVDLALNPIQVDGVAYTTVDLFSRQLWNNGNVVYDWSTGVFHPGQDIAFPNVFSILQFGSDPGNVKSGLPLRLYWDGTYLGPGALALDDGAGNLQVIRANINGDSVSAGTGGFNSLSAFTGVITSLQTSSIVNDAGLASDIYTPTLTNVANLSASTAYSCQYMRVGNTVTVSGQVDIDPVAATTLTRLGISLPVASNFANANECGGTAAASGVAGQVAAIRGDATNNRAELVFISNDTTNQPMYFSFTYRVI